MNNFFISLFALTTFSIIACTNFSGTFYDSETFVMKQSGCESITIDDAITFHFDNKEQLYFEYTQDDILLQYFVTNSMLEEKWIIHNRLVYTYPDNSTQIEKNWSENFLNQSGDIVTITHLENGGTSKSITKKLNFLVKKTTLINYLSFQKPNIFINFFQVFN